MPPNASYVVALHSTSAEKPDILPIGSLALAVMPRMLAEDDTLELHFMNAAAFLQHFKPVDEAFPYFIEKQVNVVASQPDSYMLVVMSPELAECVEREFFRGHSLPHFQPKNRMWPTSFFKPTKATSGGSRVSC